MGEEPGTGGLFECSRDCRSAICAGHVYAYGRVYSGQKCEGVNLVLTERNALDAPELGIELATALQKLYPADFKIGRIGGIAGESGGVRWR